MPSSPGEVASANLTRELKSWQSIEFAVRGKGTNHVLREGLTPSFVNLDRNIETEIGERMLDRVSQASTDRPGARRAAYCDGKKCANVT
jgi:hypothetical protein